MIRRLTFSALMIVWLLALPIFAIGMGLSEFRALSPIGFASDLVRLPTSWVTLAPRLGAWLYIAYPPAFYYLLLGRHRNQA